MWSVQITRLADQAVGDQLAEMRRWLAREGIQPFELRAVRIQSTRFTYSATFADAAAAHRFFRRFSDLD